MTANDNDPHNLLRNPRRITPPSERYGLDRWRKLPVEGQGQPLQPRLTIGEWLLIMFGSAAFTYFLLRGLF